ncbi:hypothetical protein STEG23_010796, partial [Scotinomys teguina]
MRGRSGVKSHVAERERERERERDTCLPWKRSPCNGTSYFLHTLSGMQLQSHTLPHQDENFQVFMLYSLFSLTTNQ